MKIIIHFLNFLIETGLFSVKTQAKLIGYMSGINAYKEENR